MPFDAEPLFVALFARLTPLAAPDGPFKIVSRRHPQKPPDTELQPALYLNARHRRPTQEINRPTLWKEIGALVTIYCQSQDDESVAPLTQINALIASVEGALERKLTDLSERMGASRFHTSLGGLCRICWISELDPHGVEIFEGFQDRQGMVLIPIDMVGISQ